MIDGVTSKPFSAITINPKEAEVSYREKVIEGSRKRYAKRRDQVERDITQRHFTLSFQKDQPADNSQPSLL
jgi:hypothetical protein